MGKTYTNGVSKVYDLQVKDDHSYLTTNGVVHNSVAGSLVAYLLRIHDVNSIQYDLLFERFHNKEKKAFPDIDTDMDPVGRDWVEQYLIKKYGEKNVAHVSNLSTMTPKVTIKDIARSLELGGSKSEAFKIANRITDTIPAATALRPHVSFDDALAESKEFREACAKYPQLEEYGRKLIGLEKNYATHAAGLIIGDTDLSTFLPLRIDKNGAVAVQYEKNRCEEVGLIKMDLLVIEHLSIVADTLKNAGVLGQKCPEPKDIPLDDAAVWADVAKGRTLGVFQMGSPHMIELCKKIKPKCIEDLSLVNALGRPSAAKSRDIYIGRRDGRVPIEFKHECLRPALESTLGVGVYEEQLMKLANTVAGWDLNKADGLRKLTKLKGKNPELAERLKLEFITDACKVSKTTVNQAEEIWVDVVEPFAGYGFNACLYKDESIDVFDANGVICRRTTIGDLFDSHTEGDFVRSRDELTKEQIFVPIKGVHDNGAKEVFEFTLDTGIQVKCSMDHKFRVSDGRMLPIKQIFEEGLDIVCM
jgi:DNA polymerase-3 subunit alpha